MKVIPCPDDSGAVKDCREEVSDYHPLTREEIATLLEEAKTSKAHLIVQIQIRLCQGIPGYVCPRHIEGPVFDKENEINHIFVENLRKGSSPALVERLYAVMVR